MDKKTLELADLKQILAAKDYELKEMLKAIERYRKLYAIMIKAQQVDGKAIVYPHRRTSEIKTVQAWTAADEKKYLSKQG